MVLNAVVASLLSRNITRYDDPVLLDKGLRMISLVSNASISIVTLTFSLTVLSVQIASQNYSPRLLDEFLKNPMPKAVISINLGAYMYCYTMNYYIDGVDEDYPVPYVAIHVLSVHIGLVLVSFVSFIHFFINGFRIESILDAAAAGSLRAASSLSAELDTSLGRDDQPDVQKNGYKVLADDSGYVTHFTLSRMLDQAVQLDVCVRYNNQIGDFVNRGTVLCYVWDLNTQPDHKLSLEDRVLKFLPASDDDENDKDREKTVERRLGEWASKGIALSQRRDSDFDVTLGIQQITDIAVRALSPGINDPQTAIQCMDVLTTLLATLATMELDVPSARDSDGNIRAFAPRRSFSFLLSMLDGIRGYAGSDLSVYRRGLRLFGDLGVILSRCGRVNRIPAVLAQIEQWMVVAKANFTTGSPELVSLKELYDHELRSIAESDRLVLKSGEEGEETKVKDLQAFETTFYKENDDDGDNVVMAFLKEVTNFSSGKFG